MKKTTTSSTGRVLSRSPEGTLLAVRVIPGAKKSQIVGEADGRLKVRVQAPPVEGKANKALLVFLARGLGLKKGKVVLARGEKSRSKTVLLAGVPLSRARIMLNTLLREEDHPCAK